MLIFILIVSLCFSVGLSNTYKTMLNNRIVDIFDLFLILIKLKCLSKLTLRSFS